MLRLVGLGPGGWFAEAWLAVTWLGICWEQQWHAEAGSSYWGQAACAAEQLWPRQERGATYWRRWAHGI
jgi:hypothetical protein